ncbi:MAG TPA: hypothetical protein VF319_14435, partial [Caldimonas sp.]
MLRRIALAGLGAASLWTAAPAHAAIAPSTPAVLGGLQATVRAPVPADALPMGNVPALVAPTGCTHGCGLFGLQTPTATQRPAEPQALPEPFLVAPDCSSVQCSRSRGNGTLFGKSGPGLEPDALPAPILVAPGCPGCVRGNDATGTLGAPLYM